MIFLRRHSNNKINKWWWQLDKLILLCILLLMFSSLILVTSSSPYVALRIGVDTLYFIKNQIFYLLSGLIVIFYLSTLTVEQNIKLGLLGFFISILLMIVIAGFGQEIKGAKRWIYFSGLSLQPSEFAKICFPVVCGFILKYSIDHNKDKIFIYLLFLCIYFLFIGLLLLQPDLGMTILISLVLSSFFFIMGISILLVIFFIFIFISGLIGSYFAFPHVHYRVNSFLFEDNPYQVTKALSSISSGKVFGKGAGQGTLKEFLPDSHTDFIFSVAAEEFGLVFNIFLLMIYSIILYRCYKVLQKEENLYKLVVIVGLVLIVLLQLIIHVASNINLIPTKGMTMPLISYGGSSMISMSILMGFLLSFTRKALPEDPYSTSKDCNYESRH
jgi:cell division protein FtsW